MQLDDGSSVSFPNELPNRSVSLTQSLLIRQEHNAEMLRPRLLTKSGSVHNHDMLLPNEFLDEDFVALRNLDTRESIKRPTRCNTTYARRRFAPLLCEIAARTKFALHFHQMILRTFECSLDRILFGMIGAQPRSQQPVNAIRVRFDCRSVTRDDAPANAPSRNQIILRHSAKRNAWNIGRNRSKRDVGSIFENQFVVNLVREDDQIVAPRNLGDLLQHLPRAQRSRR